MKIKTNEIISGFLVLHNNMHVPFFTAPHDFLHLCPFLHLPQSTSNSSPSEEIDKPPGDLVVLLHGSF